MGSADPLRVVITGDGAAVYCGALRVVVGTEPPPAVPIAVGRSPGTVWAELDRSDDDAG